MAKTGSHLKIQQYGENAMGVDLKGDTRQPEPIHFRVSFPGGEVDITRLTDGSGYWVHVIANNPERSDLVPDEFVPAAITDARLHMLTKHSSEADLGDFANPGLYDVALLIKRA
jgi:hypothetical protein